MRASVSRGSSSSRTADSVSASKLIGFSGRAREAGQASSTGEAAAQAEPAIEGLAQGHSTLAPLREEDGLDPELAVVEGDSRG